MKPNLFLSYAHIPLAEKEERVSMILSILSACLGAALLAIGVTVSALKLNLCGILTAAFAGAASIVPGVLGAVHHGIGHGREKRILRVLTHCAMLLQIACVYTPLLLCALRPAHPAWAWMLFALVWSCAVCAVTLYAVNPELFMAPVMLMAAILVASLFAVIIALHALLGIGGILAWSFGALAALAAIGCFMRGRVDTDWHLYFHLCLIVSQAVTTLALCLFVF